MLSSTPCIPIHIYLTTSINIRLTQGSRTIVANIRFHKKARLIRKAVRKCLLASLSNPIQSKKEKSSKKHGHPNKLPPNGGDNLENDNRTEEFNIDQTDTGNTNTGNIGIVEDKDSMKIHLQVLDLTQYQFNNDTINLLMKGLSCQKF